MAVSFYIHIPFCLSKCSYCDFFSVGRNVNSNLFEKDGTILDSYVNALCKEIVFRQESLFPQKIKTVYIGGGTPSLLKPNQIYKILETVKKYTETSSEITIEANPDDITKSFLNSCAYSGINRLSVGVQSFEGSSLSFCSRRADSKTVLNALSLIKENWNGIFSADMISALPLQTEKDFLLGLKKLCLFEPNHISLYSLTIEENTALGKLFSSGKLDYDFDLADEMWLKGKDFLQNEGYLWYEVSNFCKKDFECVHNLSYWNLDSYAAAGSGACSSLWNKDGSGMRINGTTDIKKYIQFWNEISIEELLSFSEKKRFEVLSKVQEVENIEKNTAHFEFLMMGFRKLNGIFEEDFKNRFNSALPLSFWKIAEKWQKKGLLKIEETGRGKHVYLCENGILFLNSFLSELFL